MGLLAPNRLVGLGTELGALFQQEGSEVGRVEGAVRALEELKGRIGVPAGEGPRRKARQIVRLLLR